MRTILIESHFYAGYVVADICLWLRRGYLRPGIFFAKMFICREKGFGEKMFFLWFICVFSSFQFQTFLANVRLF